jgi:DNA replication and repair protein RecF
MKLNSLELSDFRNYSNLNIEFGAQKNFLIGNNAQGKTNLLEAIYLLCISKSFRTRFEKEAIQFSKQSFIIKGDFFIDDGNLHKLIFQCSSDKGKEISLDRKRLNKSSELIGRFPIVISSPDEYSLTLGPPQERRRFVDILLSQIHKKYFFNLQEYHRTLQQRNVLLNEWRRADRKKLALIDPWNQQLIEAGSQIIQYRVHFSKLLSEQVGKIYSDLVVNNEDLSFDYKPNISFNNIEDIKLSFEKRVTQLIDKEIYLGTSLSGPHRDDFIFKINNQEIKKYGSRGQHKTVLLSLAFAEFDLIKEHRKEIPIILIDDLYSEIDRDRERKIAEKLDSMGQVFITSTDNRNEGFSNAIDRSFLIDDGIVKALC